METCLPLLREPELRRAELQGWGGRGSRAGEGGALLPAKQRQLWRQCGQEGVCQALGRTRLPQPSSLREESGSPGIAT